MRDKSDVMEIDNSNQQDASEPIVTINRKKSVYGSLVAIFSLGSIIFGATLYFGAHAAANIDGVMLLLLGIFVCGLCAVGFVWIRARWICVAVLDPEGMIASTLEQKYDLKWSELIGARTKSVAPKGGKQMPTKLLLLLEGEHCLEMPVDFNQLNSLYRILSTAQFNPTSQGQRLGTLKGSALFFFGAIALVLGIWWVTQLLGQLNNGVLFKGNFKAILLKVALGMLGPAGGFGCMCWGLYHVMAKPILYHPGWISNRD